MVSEGAEAIFAEGAEWMAEELAERMAEAAAIGAEALSTEAIADCAEDDGTAEVMLAVARVILFFGDRSISHK